MNKILIIILLVGGIFGINTVNSSVLVATKNIIEKNNELEREKKVRFFLENLPLGKTPSGYTKNMKGEMIAFEIEKKFKKTLEKFSESQRKIFKEKIEERIADMIGKDYMYVGSEQVNSNRHFYSFKKYLLLKITRQIHYGYGIPTILENSFVKALVYDREIRSENNERIFSTNNAMYAGRGKRAEFFYIPNGVSAKEFIYQKFIKNKYEGKCKLIERKHSNQFTKKHGFAERIIYSLEMYGKYEKKVNQESEKTGVPLRMGACGNYGFTNAERYFEILSKKVLMFARPGHEGTPIDYSTIQVKDNIVLEEDKILKDYGNGLLVKQANNGICLLFQNDDLLFVSERYDGICPLSEVQKHKNGIYFLVQSKKGTSHLIRVAKKWSLIEYILEDNKLIEKFEILKNKKIKIFHSKESGGGVKIIQEKESYQGRLGYVNNNLNQI